MAIELRRNSDIKGIPIGNITAFLDQFADDLDAFSEFSQHSLTALLNTLQICQQHTGLTVNYNKTALYRIGSIKKTNAKLYTQHEIRWTSEDISVLGTTVTHKQNTAELNYEGVMVKVKAILSSWKHRGLSLEGKILVINSLIMSLFVYKMQVIPNIPQKIIKQLEVMLKQFIWNNKKAKVPIQTLTRSRNQGGLNLTNIKNREIAIKATWIQILQEDSKTAQIAYYAMGEVAQHLQHSIWQLNLHKMDVKHLFPQSSCLLDGRDTRMVYTKL